MKLGKLEIRIKSHCFAGLFLIILLTVALLRTDQNDVILEEQDSRVEEKRIARNVERKTGVSSDDSVSRCNLFSGRWVFDDVAYPLYDEKKCSFMTNEFACEKYGRKELKYQNWRWQPHQCDLPRFNGSAFMEKIRGKRVVFVGDSLNRNQWISMLCLIESSLRKSSPKDVVQNDNLLVFQAIVRQFIFVNIFKSNGDSPVFHRVKDRVIRIKSIEKHARHWTDADILIFNSFTWWLQPNMTIFGESWNGENCYNVTEPISKQDYWGIETDADMMHIAESTIRKLEKQGLKVEYLNITHLSDYRKDAHPSIYKEFLPPPNEEQLSNPKSYSDCVHWCLPGVPDVWNQIIYDYIIKS
ncbi:PREDICTED: protein trichome birefringence-like 34 [Erythranthe guttata]|uniref:protein trichome birefringence-like 34 n=1 Tax=Erythranthe guttata TaxID=4155 RepID=UPI00064DB540|nr:PREDICTED: protein trichome birefringence-like 34 [Erythranthe guttata]|eukprot:XP_012831783.1 PREDICTED: protein trichome birefringence-like 34 [Erythranthe guttata]